MKYRYFIVILFFFCLSFMVNADTQAPLKIDSYKPTTTLDQKLQALLKTLSPEEKTALANRVKEEDKVASNPYSLILYNPTYILPFYYTQSPYTAVYKGQTPDNQKVMSSEFKAQLSFQIPIVRDFLSTQNSFNLGYTQDFFWQVYAQSQYFRETNYEPELFLRRIENPHLTWKLAIVHQSNGRGGKYERSWNRLYGEGIYSGANWSLSLKPWLLIFQKESSDLHNPNIANYLGHGRLVFAYKDGGNTFSLMTRNNFESHFKYGAEQLTWSFPIHGHFRGYFLAFSGYGQSLIEYDHYTNAFALGIDLSDWI